MPEVTQIINTFSHYDGIKSSGRTGSKLTPAHKKGCSSGDADSNRAQEMRRCKSMSSSTPLYYDPQLHDSPTAGAHITVDKEVGKHNQIERRR